MNSNTNNNSITCNLIVVILNTYVNEYNNSREIDTCQNALEISLRMPSLSTIQNNIEHFHSPHQIASRPRSNASTNSFRCSKDVLPS
jgi:hypothetical protein